MSPFLFIMCFEMFTRLMRKEEDSNNLNVIKINKEAPAISHILYTDNLMVACKATMRNMDSMRKCLDTYEG